MNRGGPGLAFVALVCGALGFGAYRFWQSSHTETIVATAVIPAPTDEPLQEVAPDSIPDNLPSLNVPDLQGKMHSLASYTGKPLLINFWASWCAPCRREIPLLNELHASQTGAGLRIVGLAADIQSNVVVFLKTTKLDYEVLAGEKEGAEAAARFGMPLVLPFTVFADSSGKIVAIKSGELQRDEAIAILAAVRRVDAGKMALGTARAQISERLKQLRVEKALKSTQTSSN